MKQTSIMAEDASIVPAFMDATGRESVPPRSWAPNGNESNASLRYVRDCSWPAAIPTCNVPAGNGFTDGAGRGAGRAEGSGAGGVTGSVPPQGATAHPAT